jgi:hypothetical protein
MARLQLVEGCNMCVSKNSKKKCQLKELGGVGSREIITSSIKIVESDAWGKC